MTADEYVDSNDYGYNVPAGEIKGKIRHGLVCAFIRAKVITSCNPEHVKEATKKSILEWQEFIMTGQ